MRKFDKYLSVAILALLAACSGDDSASSNEVESSDAPYSLEASSSSVGSSSSFLEESSSSEVLPESSSSPVSSSSVVQSSSSIVAVPCKTETEDNCKYGTLVDERDGQTYRTVIIGEQEWMAENLNYAYLQPTSTLDSSSWCYDNDPANCETYGRLYLWSAAVDSAALFSEDGRGFGYDGIDCEFDKDLHVLCDIKGVTRGACPSGWHLPNYDEWEELFKWGNYSNGHLKSRYNWDDSLAGTDDYGFEALPSGYVDVYTTVEFFMKEEVTDFWARKSTPRTADFATEDGFYADDRTVMPAFPIRCIRNE